MNEHTTNCKNYEAIKLRLYAMWGDLPNVEDALQDAFFQLYRGWKEKYHAHENPIAWLCIVAKQNIWRNFRKRLCNQCADSPSDLISVADHTEAECTRLALEKILAQLPPRQSQALY